MSCKNSFKDTPGIPSKQTVSTIKVQSGTLMVTLSNNHRFNTTILNASCGSSYARKLFAMTFDSLVAPAPWLTPGLISRCLNATEHPRVSTKKLRDPEMFVWGQIACDNFPSLSFCTFSQELDNVGQTTATTGDCVCPFSIIWAHLALAESSTQVYLVQTEVVGYISALPMSFHSQWITNTIFQTFD